MEILFIYLLKSSGLIAIFYLAYHFLVRKETFFNSNRWFLLGGLVTSLLLPLLFIKKIILVEKPKISIEDLIAYSQQTTNTLKDVSVVEAFDWMQFIWVSYIIIVSLLVIKIVFNFISLYRMLYQQQIIENEQFKLVNVNENIAPFSFFNFIVYNADLYSGEELQSILLHEKIHSQQRHSLDVLVAKLFCILFWFNPFVWLYKKAITQNLEYIADQKAIEQLEDKKSYQRALLKVVSNQSCLSITNNFYQSLIKKRIVMLNKNQSNKRNSWKYALVLPLLVAFVFLFQIKVIAQEKVVEPQTNKIVKNNTISADSYKSNTQENAPVSSKPDLSSDKEIYIDGSKVSQIDLNKLNPDEIVTMNVEKNSDKSTIRVITKKGSAIANDTEIYVNGKKISKEEMEDLDQNTIETMNVDKNSGTSTIKIITKKGSNIPSDTEIYVNGKKISKEEMENFDQNSVETMNVDKKGKTIRVITKINNQTFNGKDIPTPPTPPAAPVFKFKTPKTPNFPKAPKAPKGDPINGDKKAWKEFDKKMEDFAKKMEAIQPEMEEFDKKMAEFDKNMEPFNIEMEAFEKKMKVFEKQMEEYESKLNSK